MGPSKGTSSDNILTLLGICGVIAPILFTVLLTLAALLRPGYSHVSQFISELGAVGTQNAIVQQTSLIVTGLLIIAFAVGLNRSIRDGRAAKLGSAFVVVFGAGMFGGGVFSCDPGCPTTGGSFTNTMHGVVAFSGLIAFILACLILWRALKKDSRWRGYQSFSLVIGIIFLGLSLIFTPLLGSGSEWAGAVQRLLIGIVMLWIEIMALRLLRLARWHN